jgi:hypothetical protein
MITIRLYDRVGDLRCERQLTDEEYQDAEIVALNGRIYRRIVADGCDYREVKLFAIRA